MAIPFVFLFVSHVMHFARAMRNVKDTKSIQVDESSYHVYSHSSLSIVVLMRASVFQFKKREWAMRGAGKREPRNNKNNNHLSI